MFTLASGNWTKLPPLIWISCVTPGMQFIELVRRKHPTMDRRSHLGCGSCSIPMRVAVLQCCCDRGEWWRPKPEGQEQKQKKSFSNLAGSP